MKEHPLFKKLNFKRLGAGMLEPPFKPDVSAAHSCRGQGQALAGGQGWVGKVGGSWRIGWDTLIASVRKLKCVNQQNRIHRAQKNEKLWERPCFWPTRSRAPTMLQEFCLPLSDHCWSVCRLLFQAAVPRVWQAYVLTAQPP